MHERMRLEIGGTGIAVVAWLTAITGTWIVYPWYRDPAEASPRSQLLANPSTADWHEFGMESKEHVAWLSPILATAVAAGAFGAFITKVEPVLWEATS